MLPEFIEDHLEAIIAERFDVLESSYVSERTNGVLIDLKAEFEKYNEVRYLLIDGRTGQLECRTFFESMEEAEAHAKQLNLESYQVGELIVPVI